MLSGRQELRDKGPTIVWLLEIVVVIQIKMEEVLEMDEDTGLAKANLFDRLFYDH